MECNLTDKTCKPCEGGVPALNLEEAKNLLKQVPQWQLDASGKIISRQFKFKNFKQTMEFINKIADISESEAHHPDVKFGYNYCEINYQTHAIKGLSENDFICAAKVNAVLK